MNELLPLLKGWKYNIKTILQPTQYTSKTIPIIDLTDRQGWFISGEVISNDKNMTLNMYLDDMLVATGTPQSFYYGGSRLIEGIPNTFLYDQKAPGTNMPMFGMSLFTMTGYPYNQHVKFNLIASISPVTIFTYQVVLVEIYDQTAFINSLNAIYGSNTAALNATLTTLLGKLAGA